MPIDLEEFARKKKRLEKLAQAREREQGKIDQMLERLRDEFGCGEEGAEKLLKKLEREERELCEEYEKEEAKVDKEFPDGET